MGEDLSEVETRELLKQAKRGDSAAEERLFRGFRHRLRRMVAIHMDRRLAARFDPSDVVQEALIEAARRLPQYLRDEPVTFYPWLRKITWEKLMQLHTHHLRRHKRSVLREEPTQRSFLPDESLHELLDQFVAQGSSPSERLVREELRARVRLALRDLSSQDRDVLVLRFLEQLSIREAAEITGITEPAFMKRQTRAIERLRKLLLKTGEENIS